MNAESYARLTERVGEPALQLLRTRRAALTYFGGSPRAATPFEWPRKDGRPLSFLGQLDLGELELNEAAPWLPSSGRLLFFYDIEERPRGFDPKDKGGWAVIGDFGPGAARPVLFPDDLPNRNRLPRTKFLRGRPYVSIPGLERVSFEEVGISEDEECDYYALSVDAFDGNPLHQIGGFPEPVQGDGMEEVCQLASSGVHCGTPEGYRSARARELREEPNDWRLLLQFDTDGDLKLMWGDSGTIYFWVRERDARARDFSSVWFALQCF